MLFSHKWNIVLHSETRWVTNRHLRGVNQEKHRAQARPKPPPHPNRPRHADGRTVPPLLGPGAIKRRTPRTGLSPGARETLKRALDCVSGYRSILAEMKKAACAARIMAGNTITWAIVWKSPRSRKTATLKRKSNSKPTRAWNRAG